MKNTAILLLAFLVACSDPVEQQNQSRDRVGSREEMTQILLKPQVVDYSESNFPLLSAYANLKAEALEKTLPIMLLPEKELLDNQHVLAQQLAVRDAQFIRDVRSEDGVPLHTEITSIRRMNQQEIQSMNINPAIDQKNLFRVELYNYFHNTVTVGYVEIGSRQVFKVDYFNATPPALNTRLKEMAVEIACNSRDVQEVTGAGKSELKTDFYPEFQQTKCERSRHLCAAPVFTINGKKITVVVDLTDMMVVGINIEPLSNNSSKTFVTERTLQNDYVAKNYCGQENDLEKDSWKITYEMTSSDGLEIKNVTFGGEPVIESAKLVDWHVSYSFKEGFGYNDAMGCPVFSAAAVVAFAGPEVEEIIENGTVAGFAIMQDFRSPVWPMACNYRYQNRYEFYKDGRFRIAGVNLGLGCGTQGWYRPIFRIALNGAKKFDMWNAGGWDNWTEEAWHLQNASTSYSPEGYLFKITDSTGKGYYIEPARGQFGVGDRGDNAYSYVVVKHPGEGDEDIPTFGPCCNENYEQGPEQYLADPEPLAEGELVFWYVPQIENDDTEGSEYCWAKTVIKDGQRENLAWPGIVGPMFVPVN